MAIFKPFGKKYLKEQTNAYLVINLEVIKYRGRATPEEAITEWLKGKTLIGRMGINLYVFIQLSDKEAAWCSITGSNLYGRSFGQQSYSLDFKNPIRSEYVWLLKCIEEDFDQTWIINNISDLSEIFLKCGISREE